MDSMPMPLEFIESYSACVICNGKLRQGFAIETDVGSIRYDRCMGCGFVIQNPRLTEACIFALYRTTDYWGRKNASTAAYSSYENFEHLRRANSIKRLNRIHKVAGRMTGRLLDVGSATGFFASIAKECGYSVTCVEPSEEMADFGRRRYGLDFLACPAEHCRFDADEFDAVTIFGTDSHFLHPVDTFRQLIAALRPGGILAMNYQNFDHWLRILFPGIKTGWNVLYNFNDRSMALLMRQLGMEILDLSLEWPWTSADHIVRSVRGYVPVFLRRITLVVPAVSYRLMIARKIPV